MIIFTLVLFKMYSNYDNYELTNIIKICNNSTRISTVFILFMS